MHTFTSSRGRSLPLGATALGDTVNFAVLSQHATAVWLVLYSIDNDVPLAEISLDHNKNRTGYHWHIRITGLPMPFRYGWRIDGPRGVRHRFDPSIVLLDPACTAISNSETWGRVADIEATCTSKRSLFVRRSFSWGEDAPPRTPIEDSILYELHVRGFTCHPTSAVAHPGTFLGLIEKIPYLKSLGVTAVELLPIHEFDETDCPFYHPESCEKLRNFWGYNTVAFAAPKSAYAATGVEHDQVNEFRQMVRAFHDAGMEIILDVVFNHTGEGDDRGRTYSLRGIDNALYYMMTPEGQYLNFTGCGNTVNCNHPLVRQVILSCLHFWVADMHVDALRFDLASILGRDRHGHVMVEPPVLEMIAEDGLLADTKLIAEPWDAAGLYQVGRFPFGKRWSEWNGRYRDDVRQFWKGDPGMASALATRITGSSDLYQSTDRKPMHSINFITCHDGFTLNDLISYNEKHNLANGEGNRDGNNDNHSRNYGQEGPTTDPFILSLRHRQARNLMTTLMISQGVPMMLGGDEFLRTQKGNNNAWCQDNEISWVNWDFAAHNHDFLRFTREIIALRRRHPALRRRDFLVGTGPSADQEPDIIWHGVQPNEPDFSNQSRSLAFVLNGQRTGREPDRDFYVAFNASHESLGFRIPAAPSGRPWRRVVDTSLASPQDIVDLDSGPLVAVRSVYQMAPSSAIILIAEGPSA